MTARVKSTLLVLATLLIGMVLGAIINARLAEQRLERIASLRSSRGFVRFMERAIEPQDAQQQEAVRAILERAAVRMGETLDRTRSELRTIMDSTRAELASVLTEAQMRQLEEHLQIQKQEFRNRRRRAPPPRP